MKSIIFTLLFFFSFNILKAQNVNNDLAEMLTFFTGEFDNFQQIWKEKEDKINDSLRHEHIHSIFLPVKMAGLGENVFFVKQYMDGDTDKIYRMRVYNFAEDKTEKAVRLDIYTFKEEAKFKNANLDPSVLKGLKAENFTTMDGCGVFWKKEKEGVFVGYMKPKACNFVSKRSGKKVFITDSLRLTPSEIWIRDEAEDENGKYVFGHKAKIPHKLLKCRPFKGWFAIRKDSTEDKYEFVGNLRLHDQGWRKRVVKPNGTPTPYTVELSQVIYENAIFVLKLAIYEEGKEKALTYTWANPEAERIGINLRYLQVGLTMIKENLKNREDKK